MPGQEQRQAAIREAAYHKWEAAGRPCGREVEFWVAAERDLGLVGNAAGDAVLEASEESFPASDAPGWIPLGVGPPAREPADEPEPVSAVPPPKSRSRAAAPKAPRASAAKKTRG